MPLDAQVARSTDDGRAQLVSQRLHTYREVCVDPACLGSLLGVQRILDVLIDRGE
jgi:hypothetical protein